MRKYLIFILLLLLLPLGVYAQETNMKETITLEGVVKDTSGETLIGATVVLKHTPTVGTTTNIDGKFKLNNISPYDIILVSYVGSTTVEIAVDKRTMINVVLKEAGQLEEVIVEAYGTRKKSSVIGSISSVSHSDLAKTPTSSITHALAGRIAGVTALQRSGEPGVDNASLNIRGISTFGGGGSGPLILIDGIEGRSINDITAEDIESLSVLKDASATAVYGVKGANGVIMITTRKGKAGKVVVSARYNVAITAPTKLPQFVDSHDYAQLKNYALQGRGELPQFSQMELDKFKYGLDPDLYPNVDWTKAITKPSAMNQTGQINVSGGTETARYYVSFGYYNEEGLLKNMQGNGYNTNIDLSKYNFRSNIDVNVTPTTVVELGISGIFFDRKRPAYGGGEILGAIMTVNPTKFPMVYSNGLYPKFDDVYNPYLYLTQYGYTKEEYNRIEANLNLIQDLSVITKGLKASFKYSYDTETSHNNNYKREIDTWIATGRDSNGNLIMSPKDQGKTGALWYERSGDGGDRVTYLEGSLNYSNIFGAMHRVDGLFLYNQRSSNIFYNKSEVRESLPYRSQGIAGRFAYSFNDRYFGEFNFGYNGSENFISNKRFGFFPSAAIGWMVSNESWFEPVLPYVDMLKIRASHGSIGNDKTGAGRFPFYTSVSKGSDRGGYNWGVDGSYWYDGAGEGIIGTPNLTWEKSKKTNIGIELGLFARSKLTVDLFHEKRTDIFVKRNSLSSVIGIRPEYLPSANLGEMENMGVDVAFEHTEKIGRVTLNALGNFSFNRNKVVATDQAPALYPYQERTGRKYYGTIDMSANDGLGYISEGLFKDQEDIDNSPQQTFAGKLYPGDIKYKDVNGDGKIDQFDRVFMQSNTPEITYGFGVSALYAGFDISVFFQGNANSNVFLPIADMKPFHYANERGNILTDVANKVFIPEYLSGDPRTENYNAKYPRLSLALEQNNSQTSDYWLRSTAFLRLKHVELGYTLPRIITNKVLISKARIYISGANLFVFDSFKLWDPEAGGMGSYPINKSGSIGVQLDF